MGFATLILSTFLYSVSKFIVCANIAGIRIGGISAGTKPDSALSSHD